MASIVRYVNTASSSGGDGTTNATSGANRAYATLAAAEAALRQNLTGITNDINDQDGNNTISLRIYVAGGADTSQVTFSNASWVTDATHRIEVILNGTTAGPQWSTGIYRLSVSPGYSAGAIQIGKAIHLDLVNLQVEATSTMDNAPRAIQFGNFAWDVRIYGGFYRTTGTTGGWDNVAALSIGSTGAFSLKVRNAALIASNGWGANFFSFNSAGPTIWLYNVTLANRSATNRSVLTFVNITSAADVRTKNLIIQGTTGGTNLYTNSVADASATILTEDASSPDASLDNKVVSFVDETNWDYHLDSGDTAAKDAGTDLSADASWPFSTDGDGETRSGSWDIGADEYVAPASGGNRRRRVLAAA